MSKEQRTTTKEMVSLEAVPPGLTQPKNVKKELEEEQFSSSNLNQNDEENNDQ